MAKIVFGRNPVLEALKSEHAIDKVFLLHGQRGAIIQKILSLAHERRISVQLTDKLRLTQMTGTKNSQGVAAMIAEYCYSDITEMLTLANDRVEPPLIALLDGIEDPHNLGAIIRSAECAGVHGIIIPQHRAVDLTETVAKTSAGALSHIAVAKVTNLIPVMEELRQAGLWIAGATNEAEKDLYHTDLSEPLGIVIGSEGRGIRRLVKEKCDFLIRIPMKGKISSLNASVAAAVVFFEVVRQRTFTS